MTRATHLIMTRNDKQRSTRQVLEMLGSQPEGRPKLSWFTNKTKFWQVIIWKEVGVFCLWYLLLLEVVVAINGKYNHVVCIQLPKYLPRPKLGSSYRSRRCRSPLWHLCQPCANAWETQGCPSGTKCVWPGNWTSPSLSCIICGERGFEA